MTTDADSLRLSEFIRWDGFRSRLPQLPSYHHYAHFCIYRWLKLFRVSKSKRIYFIAQAILGSTAALWIIYSIVIGCYITHCYLTLKLWLICINSWKWIVLSLMIQIAQLQGGRLVKRVSRKKMTLQNNIPSIENLLNATDNRNIFSNIKIWTKSKNGIWKSD